MIKYYVFLSYLLLLGLPCNNKAFLEEMYPTPEFSKVEKICKELTSDLIALNFNPILHNEWVENSDYLVNQFLLLNDSIANLVNNTEESRSYLLEDIHYLLTSITSVEEGYNDIYESFTRNPLCQFMQALLLTSKDTLNQLLFINQEIIGA